VTETVDEANCFRELGFTEPAPQHVVGDVIPIVSPPAPML